MYFFTLFTTFQFMVMLYHVFCGVSHIVVPLRPKIDKVLLKNLNGLSLNPVPLTPLTCGFEGIRKLQTLCRQLTNNLIYIQLWLTPKTKRR